MNVDMIKKFIAVAELGSLSRVAEKYYISQPALSKSIHEFEKEIGCALFDRSSKGMKLNSNGEIVLFHCENILNEINLMNQVLKTKNASFTTIKFNVQSTSDFFQKIVKEYKSFNEDVKFDIVQGLPRENNNNYYTIFSTDKKLTINSRLLLLMEEPIKVAVNKEHEFFEKEFINLEDLKSQQFVSLSHNSNIQIILRNQLSKYKFYPHIFLESNNPQFIINSVKQGLGLAFAPEKAWKFPASEVRLIDIKGINLHRYVYLKIPKYKKLNKVETNFIEFLKSKYSNIWNSKII